MPATFPRRLPLLVAAVLVFVGQGLRPDALALEAPELQQDDLQKQLSKQPTQPGSNLQEEGTGGSALAGSDAGKKGTDESSGLALEAEEKARKEAEARAKAEAEGKEAEARATAAAEGKARKEAATSEPIAVPTASLAVAAAAPPAAQDAQGEQPQKKALKKARCPGPDCVTLCAPGQKSGEPNPNALDALPGPKGTQKFGKALPKHVAKHGSHLQVESLGGEGAQGPDESPAPALRERERDAEESSDLALQTQHGGGTRRSAALDEEHKKGEVIYKNVNPSERVSGSMWERLPDDVVASHTGIVGNVEDPKDQSVAEQAEKKAR